MAEVTSKIPNRLAFWSALAGILSSLLICGCGSGPSQQTIDLVRQEAAETLGKKVTEIDVAKPLVAQGADELDLVEIIMGIEEKIGIEIPDSAFGENAATKDFTVHRIAVVVSELQKKQ
jgi:acyl carrier protein